MSRFALAGKAATVFAALSVLFMASSPVWAQDRDPNDLDGDTVPDAVDNCPKIANTDQKDTDGDGRGDVCDNCPDDANNDQADADSDGRGDVCDAHYTPNSITLSAGGFLLAGQSYAGILTGWDLDSLKVNIGVMFGDGSDTVKFSDVDVVDGVFSVNLAHQYKLPGKYDIIALVTDDTGDSRYSAPVTVQVLSLQDGIRDLIARIDKQVILGMVKAGQVKSVKAALNAAIAKLDAGDKAGAKMQLKNAVTQIQKLMQSGQLPVAEGTAWINSINVIISLIG